MFECIFILLFRYGYIPSKIVALEFKVVMSYSMEIVKRGLTSLNNYAVSFPLARPIEKIMNEYIN